MSAAKLTDAEWARVFRLRCDSKQGRALTDEDHALIRAAFEEDGERYGAGEKDVFNATVPFGSAAKREA